jgi:hypothetical protein
MGNYGRLITMTKFERNMAQLQESSFGFRDIYVNRYNEIKRLRKEGRAARNNFRMQCIAEELVQRLRELDMLEKLVSEKWEVSYEA